MIFSVLRLEALLGACFFKKFQLYSLICILDNNLLIILDKHN